MVAISLFLRDEIKNGALAIIEATPANIITVPACAADEVKPKASSSTAFAAIAYPAIVTPTPAPGKIHAVVFCFRLF